MSGVGLALVKGIWESGTLFFRNRTTLANVMAIAPEGVRETMSVVDVDSQHATLLAATVKAGILTHNSKTGGGNLTMDTGTNLDLGFPTLQVGEVLVCYYINRGDQTVTLVNAAGATVTDTGQTIAQNESAVILLRKTATATYVVYHVGG